MAEISVSLPPEVVPSLGRRAVGAVIDGVLLVAVVFALAAIGGTLPTNSKGDPVGVAANVFAAIFVIVVLIGPTLFHAWCIRHGGRTPGHRMVKVHAVSITGDGRPSWADSVRRGLAWELGMITLGLGLWVVGRNELRRAWTDRLGDTIVVDAGYAPTLREFVAAHEPEAPVPPSLPAAPPPPVTVTVAPGPRVAQPLAIVAPDVLTVPLLRRHHWIESAAVLRLTPEEPEVFDWLGFTLAMTQTPDVRRWLNELAVTHGAPAIQVGRVMHLAMEGDLAEAEQALATVPADEHLVFRAVAEAAIARRAGRHDEADGFAAAYVADGGDEFISVSVQARAADVGSHVASGMQLRRRALELAPWDFRELALAVMYASHPKPRLRAAANSGLAPEVVMTWAERLIEAAPASTLTDQAVRLLTSVYRRGPGLPESVERYASFCRQVRALDAATTARARRKARPSPPPGSIFADPERCRCAELESVVSDSATVYADRHLVIVQRVERLEAVVARCPNGVTSWFGLEQSEPEALGRPTLVRIPDLVAQELAPRDRPAAGYL